MYFKQIREIVEGRKTCTQRIAKLGETAHVDEDGEIRIVFDAHGRIKWQVGRDYAVSPGRGECGALWKIDTNLGVPVLLVFLPDDRGDRQIGYAFGFVPLRIRLLKIERVALHSTDERVAIAEGVQNLAAYIKLWGVIYGVRAWLQNPMVWRLWFEVVK